MNGGTIITTKRGGDDGNDRKGKRERELLFWKERKMAEWEAAEGVVGFLFRGNREPDTRPFFEIVVQVHDSTLKSYI